MSAKSQTEKLRLRIENIGGIRTPLEVEFKRGLNVIKAPNATGKTSIVRGLEVIIGNVPPEDVLTDGEREGKVVLSYDEQEYTAKLYRTGIESVKLERDLVPIYDPRTSLIAVALPENKILRKLSEGDIVFSDVLEELSNAEKYLAIVEAIRELIPEHKNRLRLLELDAKESERIKAQIEVLKERIRIIEKELQELVESPEQKELSERIAQLKNELQEKKTEKKELERELKEKKSLLREKEAELKKVRGEITDLEQKYPGLDFDSKEKWYKSQIETLEEKRKKETEPLLRKLYNEREAIIEQIKKLERGELERGKCPFCAETCPKYSDNLMRIRLNELEEEIQDAKAKDDEITQKIRELKAERDDVKRDRERLRGLKDRVRRLVEEEIPELKREVSRLEKEIKNKEREVERKQEEISELEKKLEIEKVEMQKERERKERTLDQLRDELSDLEGQSKDLDKKYEKGVEKTKRYELVVIEELTKLAEYFEERYTTEKTGAKKVFNESIRRVFERLGFGGFSKIEINKEDTLEIYREGGTKTTPRKLSTSEGITVGLILMISAYEAYLKDRVPIFVLDEVTLSYDPTRFKEIVNYLAERVPYLIITTVVPAEEKEIRVEHSL